MTQTLKAVLDAAMELPADERAELADRLLTSCEGASREEIDAAWVAECDRRMDRIEKGLEQTIPGPQALQRLRERRTA